MEQAKDIHNDAIIIDCTCPLAVLDEYHDNYMKGGVTVIAATVGYGMANIGNLDFAMKILGKWFAKFREDGRRSHKRWLTVLGATSKLRDAGRSGGSDFSDPVYRCAECREKGWPVDRCRIASP